MKLTTIHLPGSLLQLTDEQLGEAVRKRMMAEIDAHEARVEAGKEAARQKLGWQIEIDGARFASRTQARTALGMSFAAFAKKYPPQV